jgi:hypothetical protein
LKDNDTARRWPSHREKVLQHPAVQGPDEGEGKQFEDARSRDSLYLELRFCDGKRRAFSLVEGPEVDFDPDDADTITLRFARANIVVKGQKLVRLYEKLLDQRARFIQQNTEAEGELQSPDEPYVEKIEILRRED